jgi:hypothetical protein
VRALVKVWASVLQKRLGKKFKDLGKAALRDRFINQPQATPHQASLKYLDIP